MGFWRKLFGIEERSAGSNDTSGVLDGGAELLRALIDGDKFTAEQALEIPAFSAAVDFISGTVSMLPVKLYRENTADSSTEEITEDRRLFLLNDEANPIMGADNAKRAAIRDMLLFGSGFLYVDQSLFGEVRSLRYVKKSDVSVMSNADPIFKDFNLFVGSRTYLPWNFVILTRNSTDGVTGIGTVDEHKTLLSAMYFMMKFERALSKTGGNKKGFLESEHKLSKEALEKTKQLWNELYANNESNMMILNDGLKYVPSASSSVEMQLNENKLTNSEQIAQIFGLSSAVLSGKCTTQEYMSAIRTAVLPIVAQFQAALNRALLREDEKGEKYFALDTTELLKGDTLSRYQAYEIALRNNFLQLDEVRYLEDKKPLGFDFMKLDLSNVLYDYKTKTIYTPNMNALQKLGDQSLTQEEMRALMEYRKKTNWIKGAHGHFAGSYPEGGGGGNLGLTNGGNGGIINVGSGNLEQAKKRDHKVYITDAAIEKVGKVNLSDFSEEQTSAMQDCHKELLKIARDENNSNEVLLISDLSFKDRVAVLGSEFTVAPGNDPNAVSLIASSSKYSLVYMHNHPSTNTFSAADIDTFVCDRAIKTMSVVTNQGEVYVINKTSSFDFNKTRLLLTDIYKSLPEGKEKSHNFVKQFLKRCNEGGIEYGK